MPPLADIVIVEGSSVHQAYQSKPASRSTRSQPRRLIAQGYCNEFLYWPLATPEEICPRSGSRQRYAPMPPRPEPEPDDCGGILARSITWRDTRNRESRRARRRDAANVYANIDSGERTGYGVAPPGGGQRHQFPQRSH